VVDLAVERDSEVALDLEADMGVMEFIKVFIMLDTYSNSTFTHFEKVCQIIKLKYNIFIVNEREKECAKGEIKETRFGRIGLNKLLFKGHFLKINLLHRFHRYSTGTMVDSVDSEVERDTVDLDSVVDLAVERDSEVDLDLEADMGVMEFIKVFIMATSVFHGICGYSTKCYQTQYFHHLSEMLHISSIIYQEHRRIRLVPYVEQELLTLQVNPRF
jgi:hypothetical protein